MKRTIIFIATLTIVALFPVVGLMAQTGETPNLWAIDFIPSETELQMWLSFDGNPSIDSVEIKHAGFPSRYIVGISPATMSNYLRVGIVYQDILSNGQMGVDRIDLTYDMAWEKVAFSAVPMEGLSINAIVRNDGVIIVKYTRIPEDENNSMVSTKEKPVSTTADEGDFQNFFSLDKASLQLSTEAEGVIRSYFAKKKSDESSGEDNAILIKDNDELVPASKQMTRPEYKIQVGDRLAIGVAGEPELDMTVQVRPDGYISYAIIGDVYVEGKTADEARKVIKRMLQPYYSYDIIVGLVITEFTPEKVYLLGKVYEAGAFPYRTGMTLLDLVGRFDERDSDIRKVKLIRGDEVFQVNMETLLAGDVSLNYKLEPDDYVVFPARVYPKAAVLGKVLHPNQWQFEDGQRLFDLIGMAGGFDQRCDIKNILILRIDEDGRMVNSICDLLDYQKNGTMENNPFIKNGDIIIVPEVGRVNWKEVIDPLDKLNTFAYWWRWQ